MTEKLEWTSPGGNFLRGGTTEATAPVLQERELTPYLVNVWQKVYEVFTDFSPAYYADFQPAVTVECWPDTGRLIFILRKKRELARLILSVPALERKYYELPRDKPSFNSAYDELFRGVVRCVTGSLVDPGVARSLGNAALSGIRIAVTDCDDKASELVVRGR